MKPDWSSAPEWARWYVCNGVGTGSWTDVKPGSVDAMWFVDHPGRVSFATLDWGVARMAPRP